MKTDDVKKLRLKVSECGKALESCGIAGVTIATLNPCGLLTTTEQREVANRIVQACNSHEELVAALRECLAWFDLDPYRSNPVTAQDTEVGFRMIQQARAALQETDDEQAIEMEACELANLLGTR